MFLGAALALPPAGLTWLFVTSWRAQPGRPGVAWALAALALLAVLIIAAVACAPPVRGVQIAAARTLLGLRLPDPRVPTAWQPRLLGAAWLGVVSAVGAVVAVGLLVLLPMGVGLLAVPWLGGEVRIAGAPATWWAGRGAGSLGWAGAGLACLLVAYLLVVAMTVATRRLAPAFLGPTGPDREALAAARARDLARANLLARELHDSVGHALTAMTLQADAARVLLRRDPAAAEAALDRVTDIGRGAVDGLDAVLGALRGDTDPTPGPQLLAELLAAPDLRSTGAQQLAELPPATVGDVARMLQEAVTNARRHGVGPIELDVRRDPAPQRSWRIRVVNDLPPKSRATGTDEPIAASAAGRPGGGRGLIGLRERALLLDGSARAGEFVDDRGRRRWAVDLEVPA